MNNNAEDTGASSCANIFEELSQRAELWDMLLAAVAGCWQQIPSSAGNPGAAIDAASLKLHTQSMAPLHHAQCMVPVTIWVRQFPDRPVSLGARLVVRHATQEFWLAVALDTDRCAAAEPPPWPQGGAADEVGDAEGTTVDEPLTADEVAAWLDEVAGGSADGLATA